MTVASPAVTVPHLCAAAETPIFACSTGKKRASVCAGPAGGHEQLAYRIAPLEGAVEMEYPGGGAGAVSAFQRGSQVAQDGTAVSFLSFDKGNYRYVVMPVAVKMDAREWWSSRVASALLICAARVMQCPR